MLSILIEKSLVLHQRQEIFIRLKSCTTNLWKFIVTSIGQKFIHPFIDGEWLATTIKLIFYFLAKKHHFVWFWRKFFKVEKVDTSYFSNFILNAKAYQPLKIQILTKKTVYWEKLLCWHGLKQNEGIIYRFGD